MGIKGDLRASRKRDVLSHLKAIFVQMVKEEEVNFEKLTTSIRRYEEERRNLMLDLHMTDDNNNYGGTNEDESLVAAESRMKKMVKKLLQEKVAQMKVFEEIKEAEEALCEATGSLPCGISLDGCLPTDAQRQAIEDHVRQLEVFRICYYSRPLFLIFCRLFETPERLSLRPFEAEFVTFMKGSRPNREARMKGTSSAATSDQSNCLKIQ